MQRRTRRLTTALVAAACAPGLAACGKARDTSHDEVVALPKDKGAPYTMPRILPAVPAGAAAAAAARKDTRPLVLPGTKTPAQIAAEAAKDAGCSLRRLPIEGADHTLGKVRYRSNPPSSGRHNPVPAPDGIYKRGKTPPKENLVHTLEHGRVELQYAPGASAKRIASLTAVAREPVEGRSDYHVLLFENRTKMPYAVAAVSWGRVLGCRRYSQKALVALYAFRVAFTDKAPELIP